MIPILPSKNKLIIDLGAIASLIIITITAAYSSNEPAVGLSAGEILKKSQETYASLISYSDEGTEVTAGSAGTTTLIFKIKLARPNLFRIEWLNTTPRDPAVAALLPPPKMKTIWSAGTGYFSDQGHGIEEVAEDLGEDPQELGRDKQTKVNLEIGLARGGVEINIPSNFFKLPIGHDLLDRADSNMQRKADEKIGDIDCYVISEKLTNALNGEIQMLWIGKQDLLIHQVRSIITKDLGEAKAENDAEATVEQIAPNLSKGPKIEPSDSICTETHTNIVVNQKLSSADFSP